SAAAREVARGQGVEVAGEPERAEQEPERGGRERQAQPARAAVLAAPLVRSRGGKSAGLTQRELDNHAAISPRTASSARQARLSTSSGLDARGDQASSRA